MNFLAIKINYTKENIEIYYFVIDEIFYLETFFSFYSLKIQLKILLKIINTY